MVAHIFNTSAWEGEEGGSLELEASLVNRASSKLRTAKVIQRNCLKKTSNKKNKNKTTKS